MIWKPIKNSLCKVGLFREPPNSLECHDMSVEECFYSTPVILGNRISGTFCEAQRNFMVCPDGSGDLGMVMDGKWLSYEGVWGERNRFGQQEFTRNKVIDLEEVA